MTVRELVWKLRECNLEAEVFVSADEHGTFEAETVWEEKLDDNDSTVTIAA